MDREWLVNYWNNPSRTVSDRDLLYSYISSRLDPTVNILCGWDGMSQMFGSDDLRTERILDYLEVLKDLSEDIAIVTGETPRATYLNFRSAIRSVHGLTEERYAAAKEKVANGR